MLFRKMRHFDVIRSQPPESAAYSFLSHLHKPPVISWMHNVADSVTDWKSANVVLKTRTTCTPSHVWRAALETGADSSVSHSHSNALHHLERHWKQRRDDDLITATT